MLILNEQIKVKVNPGAQIIWFDEQERTGSNNCLCSYCCWPIKENAIRIHSEYQELRFHDYCFNNLRKREIITLENPDGQEDEEKV